MTHFFSIDRVDSLYFLKNNPDIIYDKIYINAPSMISAGIIHYAIKYAYWHISSHGEIVINCPDDSQQNFSHTTPCEWQLFNVLSMPWYKEHLITNCVDNVISCVKVENCANSYSYNGISIGIVFSGAQEEELKLIESLSQIESFKDIDHEVVICGPVGYDSSRITRKIKQIKVKYISLDEGELYSRDRFFISKKKNYLYGQLRFDIKVISHSRIKYPKYFIRDLFSKKFDIAGPMVKDNDGNRYLDMVLIGSYDTCKLNSKRTLSGVVFKNDYLKCMKYRVPYIDGGVIIFNSRVIGDSPFNDDIAWGEAEDVDVVKKYYNKGCLVDILESIECISLSRKFPYKMNAWFRLKYNVLRMLAIYGVF